MATAFAKRIASAGALADANMPLEGSKCKRTTKTTRCSRRELKKACNKECSRGKMCQHTGE